MPDGADHDCQKQNRALVHPINWETTAWKTTLHPLFSLFSAAKLKDRIR